MRGPGDRGKAYIVNAGSGVTGYSECGVRGDRYSECGVRGDRISECGVRGERHIVNAGSRNSSHIMKHERQKNNEPRL
ncbi:unnamed protein product, partial [Staurois parvus]